MDFDKNLNQAYRDPSRLDEFLEEIRKRPEEIDSRKPWSSGGTWLHKAAFDVRVDLVEPLLKLGFSTDIRDNLGNVPLNEAICSKSPEIARLLLDYGSPLLADRPENNPLFAAIVPARSTELVQLLLDAGMDTSPRYRMDAAQGAEMDAIGFAYMWRMDDAAEAIARHQAAGDQDVYERLLQQGLAEGTPPFS